jgi:hypothetical protein
MSKFENVTNLHIALFLLNWLSWLRSIMTLYWIKLTNTWKVIMNPSYQVLMLHMFSITKIWLESYWDGQPKCLVFSGGRPEASKRNLNFQSATWHSSIGPGGSRMVSPPVHFPKLILWPPLFNGYPLWGSLECKYMHILLMRAERVNNNENFQK